MEHQVRCAVLGLGRLGYYHAKNFVTSVPGAKLVSVGDPLKGRAEQVARESVSKNGQRTLMKC